MLDRRKLVAALALGAAPAVVAAACSFPEVEYAAGFEAGPETSVIVEEDDGGIVLSDGAVVADVVVRDDATARVEPDACADDDCDCDRDGYLRAGCDAGPGEEDCDDLDPLRHPNADWTVEEPVGHDGDWNCDGVVERRPKVNLECGGLSVACTGGSGFTNVPPCGIEADFYICQPEGLLGCAPIPNGARVKQICR